MGRFSNKTGTAKLGIRYSPNGQNGMRAATVPSIANTHSLLIEAYIKFNSVNRYVPYGSLFGYGNTVDGDYIYFFVYSTPYFGRSQIETYKTGIGWLSTGPVMYEKIWKSGTMYHFSFLWDRTNSLRVLYANGARIATTAISTDIRTNQSNSTVWFAGRQGTIAPGIDGTYILGRFTTLSSVPSDIDAAIERMYTSPMTLDNSLRSVAVLASQWDLTTDAYSTSSRTTLADTGIVGGNSLTSSEDIRPLLKIVEKP